jgi:glycosyltransferase involved in cell wall biosynthesis
MDRCARENIDVEFDAVIPWNYVSYFTGCTNVRMHINIAEADLMKMYQRADALFLPVTGATANNSVLESLACGTPVISTDIGGISDYVDSGCGWLFPAGDVDSTFGLINSLAKNRDPATSLRPGARTRAEKFSWNRVAAQVTAGYQRVASGGHFAETPGDEKSPE